MKTNKSFTKRLRVTKKGKILARTAGNNHFNAKRSSRERLNKSKDHPLEMSNVLRSRFLPNTPNL